MESPDERPEQEPEEWTPPSLEDNPELAARVFRTKLWILLVGGIALAGLVAMCVIVGILIIGQY